MLQTFDQTRKKIILSAYLISIIYAISLAYYPIESIIIIIGILSSTFLIEKIIPKLGLLKTSCILLMIGSACIIIILNEFGIITINKSYFIAFSGIAYFLYFIACFKSFKACLTIYFCVCSLSLFYLGIRPTGNMPIITLDRILYIPIILSFTIQYIKHRKRLTTFPWHLGFLLLLASHILSLVYAMDRGATINAILRVTFEYYLLAFMVYHTFDEDWEVFKWLLIVAVIVSVYSFIEAKLGYNPMAYIITNIPAGLKMEYRINEIRLFSHRVNSIFITPIIFSVYLVLSISIANFQLVKLAENRKERFISLIILFILFAALILTGTRGCWVAAAAGIMLTHIYAFKVKKIPFYFVIIALLLIGSILAFEYTDVLINGAIDLFQRESGYYGSGTYRLQILGDAIYKIKFMGLGVKNYDWNLGRFIGFSIGDLCNEFVLVGIEQGIIGIIAYLLFYGQIGYTFYKRRKPLIFTLFIPWIIVLFFEGNQNMMPYFCAIMALSLPGPKSIHLH